VEPTGARRRRRGALSGDPPIVLSMVAGRGRRTRVFGTILPVLDCGSVEYNESFRAYNNAMAQVMTVSRNGQVSIPAAARARWATRKVVVVDLGDRVVLRPAAADPVAALQGKYAGHGPDSSATRRQERSAEQRAEVGRGRRATDR